MRKYQWVAVVAVFAAWSVAALGEVPTTPGSDDQRLTGGNGSFANIRPGLRPYSTVSGVAGARSLKEAFNRDDALTGLRYRKLRNLSMVDYYPVAGFHLSGGFRSWKGKLPNSGAFPTPGSVGRLNMNAVAPLMPIRNTHSNLSPQLTAGYETKLAKFTQVGFEAGMLSESGTNRGNLLPGERSQRWASTGAIAQASLKMRFF